MTTTTVPSPRTPTSTSAAVLAVLTCVSLVAAACSSSTNGELTESNLNETPTSQPSEVDAASTSTTDSGSSDTESEQTSADTSVIVSDGESVLVIGEDDQVSEEASGSGQSSTIPQADGSAANPSSVEELAAALSEAELAVRSTTLSAQEMRNSGRRQQFLYRLLSVHPEWVDELPALVDPKIRSAVEKNIAARTSLSSLVNSENLADTLPAWEVAEPLPPETLIEYYKAAEAETNIHWEFLAAINLVETRMGRIRGLSTAGAVGPMQFLPTTWAECCQGDPTVPEDAILGAGKYLVRRGGPDNMPRALFGYNNSDYYVEAVSAYASVMMEDERAYWGYHGWEVYYLSSEGLIEIPIGYKEAESVGVKEWLAENPEALIDIS